MPDQPETLAALLAQLEAERAELDITISLIRRRMNLNGESPPTLASPLATPSVGRDTPVTGRVRSDEFFRLSIADAIAKFLGIMKQPQKRAAIVAGLKAGGVLTQAKNFPANVNTELKRMTLRGVTVNTPSGWGLAEWYPNKPKQSESPKAKKKKGKGKPKAHKPGAKASPATDRASAVPVSRESSSRENTGWHAFAAEKIRGGMTMAEAAAEWRKKKPSAIDELVSRAT